MKNRRKKKQIEKDRTFDINLFGKYMNIEYI